MSKSKGGPAREIASLLEERRRYERWLAALQERRATTPEHVLARVRGDYEARLAQVTERLAGHRDALTEQRNGLQSRLALLDAEIQLRNDERLEVELRASVGELSDGEVHKSLESLDEAISRLAREREDLESSLRTMSELLTDAVPAAESSSADAVSAPPEAAPESKAPARGPRARRTTPFDELKFLSAVVGEADANHPVAKSERTTPPAIALSEVETPSESAPDPDAAPAAEAAAPESAPPESAPPPPSEPAEVPYAANVPANTPITLRPSAATGLAKTLKCAECDALNFPTEWYCERCGAELVAL